MNDANTALLERDAEHLIHPLQQPLHAASAGGKVWVRGEGAVLIDANGDRYLDGFGWLVEQHCRQRLSELRRRSAKQMLELGLFMPQAIPAVPTCRRARGRTPGKNHLPEYNVFSPLAAASPPTAISKWRGITGSCRANRTKPGDFRQWGYTGSLWLPCSATGINSYWPMRSEPRVPGFVHIPSPYPYRYQAPEGWRRGSSRA